MKYQVPSLTLNADAQLTLSEKDLKRLAPYDSTPLTTVVLPPGWVDREEFNCPADVKLAKTDWMDRIVAGKQEIENVIDRGWIFLILFLLLISFCFILI